jgi:photosystem II stability/assembly factor-like uncharacterized protein
LPSSLDTDLPSYDPGELDRMLARATARSRAMRARRRRLGALTGAFAAVLVLALIAGTLVLAPRSPNRAPAATGSQPTLGGRRASSTTWVLVSETTPPWRRIPTPPTPNNPPVVPLSCPSVTTCFTLGSVTSGSRTVVQLDATNDGGRTWRTLTLPTQLGPNASFSCATAQTCALLGLDPAGAPVFLETTDGGQRWSSTAGPSTYNPNTLITLDCTTAQRCTAIGTEKDLKSGGSAFSVSTSDGGARWSQAALPPSFTPFSLQCVGIETCIVTGLDTTTPDAKRHGGAAVHSTDGGATWQPSTVPSGTGVLTSAACADATDCLTISAGDAQGQSTVLRSTDGGRIWTHARATGLPDAVLSNIVCPSRTDCWVSGAIVPSGSGGAGPAAPAHGLLALSTNDGQTWQPAQLPAGVPLIVSVSCPNTTACYALSILKSTSHPGLVFGLLSNRAG